MLKGRIPMKNPIKGVLALGFLLLCAAPSQAWVSVGFRFGDGWRHRHHYGGWVGAGPVWPYYPTVYPVPVYVQEPVVQQPVIIQQAAPAPAPVYAPAPAPMYAPAPEPLPNTAGYAEFLNRFDPQLMRERNMLDRLLGKGSLSVDQY